jgi:hypothetical protein
MSNELATIQHRQLNPQVWDMLQSVGMAAYESRSFGLKKHEGAVKMAVAFEFGLPITTALSSVYVIENKPVMAPKLLWARAQSHPDFESYDEERLEDEGAFEGWRITIKRKGMPPITREFTMTQAQNIVIKSDGTTLADKHNWKNYPEDVCYWRAIDRTLHVSFADVCMGLYAADELGIDVTPDGEVIEGAWEVQEIEPEPESESHITVSNLVEMYGADKVLGVLGKIPETPEELQHVFETLDAEVVEEIAGAHDDAMPVDHGRGKNKLMKGE